MDRYWILFPILSVIDPGKFPTPEPLTPQVEPQPVMGNSIEPMPGHESPPSPIQPVQWITAIILVVILVALVIIDPR